MLKTWFKREESKHFIYWGYKNFNDTEFNMGLENKLEECPKHYEHFEDPFVYVSDAHAPRKTKVLRGNINLVLIRIFVKPLWSALNLKTKQTELY